MSESYYDPGRLQTLLNALKSWMGMKPPGPPEDPYSYVAAPKNPRLPGLSTAAVAEYPDEEQHR